MLISVDYQIVKCVLIRTREENIKGVFENVKGFNNLN